MFDVSRLLELHPPLGEIRDSFRKCLTFENNLQGRTIPPDAVVRDTLASCRSVIDHTEPPVMPRNGSVLEEHCSGLAPFADHLFKKGYSWADLQIDMARAACCIVAAGSDSVSREQFARAFADGDAPPGDPDGSSSSNDRSLRRYWDYIDSWMEGAAPAGDGEDAST